MTVTHQGAPPRARGERAPRSGGRTAASTTPRRDAAGFARAFPVDGTAALRPRPTEEVPAPQPRLRVAPPLPVAVPRTPFLIVVLTVVIGGVLGILLLNTKINENAFKLDDLHRKQTSLTQQQQELERELAVKESSGDLEAQARRLGLIPADKPAYLRMPDGRVFGVPQPATGAPSITSQTVPGR